MSMVEPKIHDRTTTDIPRNVRVIKAVVDEPPEFAHFPGAQIEVTRSIRDDPLAGMLARGQIDKAMFSAGREWQRYHDNSQIGGIRAIDPTKEAVDGGRMAEPLSLRQMKASDEINLAKKELGYEGNRLISNILGDGKSIQEYAMSLGLTSEREFNYIGRRLRECLDTLAKLWGYA